MNSSVKIFLTLIVVFSIHVSFVYAHPGGLDTRNGHYCRTNCESWGLNSNEYHKHTNDGSYTTEAGFVYSKQGEILSEPEIVIEKPAAEEVQQIVSQNASEATIEPQVKQAQESQENETPENINDPISQDDDTAQDEKEDPQDSSGGTGVIIVFIIFVFVMIFILARLISKSIKKAKNMFSKRQ